MAEITWNDVVAAKVGTVFVDRFDEGVRFLIMRGPFHLCAYIGIPLDHPLAGHDYGSLPLDCHGGITYAREGGAGSFPAGFYWYGWHYGHCDDYMISDTHSSSYAAFNETQTKWDVKMVEEDSWLALYGFKKLMKLAETIVSNAKTGSAIMTKLMQTTIHIMDKHMDPPDWREICEQEQAKPYWARNVLYQGRNVSHRRNRWLAFVLFEGVFVAVVGLLYWLAVRT